MRVAVCAAVKVQLVLKANPVTILLPIGTRTHHRTTLAFMRRGKSWSLWSALRRNKKSTFIYPRRAFRNYSSAPPGKGITSRTFCLLSNGVLDNACIAPVFYLAPAGAPALITSRYRNWRKSIFLLSDHLLPTPSRKQAKDRTLWRVGTAAGRGVLMDSAGGAEMSASVASLPTRADIDRSINEQLIVELYSK